MRYFKLSTLLILLFLLAGCQQEVECDCSADAPPPGYTCEVENGVYSCFEDESMKGEEQNITLKGYKEMCEREPESVLCKD